MSKRKETGDVIYVFTKPDEYKAYVDRIAAITKWQEGQPNGYKTIRFYLTRDYKFNYSRTFSILYKKEIISFHAVTDTPEYKSHKINVTEGRVITADPEQIAFLDMHKGFVREENRPLSPMEKERKDVQDLQVAKTQLEAEVTRMKNDLIELSAIKEMGKNGKESKGSTKDS